jgi:hypothetical protein
VRLTIAFITGRAEPLLYRMLESLAPQVDAADEIDVLVIDMQGRTPVQLGARRNYGHWIPSIRVELPKPTPWQGAYRITTCDWWAKSSAMNTAFVLCQTDYIAFLDDCCRLGPKWLETIRRGERERRSVLAGTYSKIARGIVMSDHRVGLYPEGRLNCGGGWLYGCTFALPLEWALEVNGAEEGCDGLGGEDYILGFMLENNGHQINFAPDLAVTLERDEISAPGAPSIPLRRADKVTSGNDKVTSGNDKSHMALARFRVRKRTEFTPDLRQLRARRALGDRSWPPPDPDMRDWYDGQLVRDMR